MTPLAAMVCDRQWRMGRSPVGPPWAPAAAARRPINFPGSAAPVHRPQRISTQLGLSRVRVEGVAGRSEVGTGRRALHRTGEDRRAWRPQCIRCLPSHASACPRPKARRRSHVSAGIEHLRVRRL